jgi:hypothetical protein
MTLALALAPTLTPTGARHATLRGAQRLQRQARCAAAPQHRSTAAPQHRSAAAPQHRSTAAPPPQLATPTPPPRPVSPPPTHPHRALTSHPSPPPPPPWADDGLAFARHWLRSNGSVVLDYEGRLFLSLWRLRAGSVALG